MIYELGKTFLFNAVTDSLLLFLIKRELFPQLPESWVWKGGLLSSITYIFWYSLSGYLCPWLHILLALITVGSILIFTFQIRAVLTFARTSGIMLLHVFTFGGFGMLLQKKLSRLRSSFLTYWWVPLSGFCILTGCMLIYIMLRRNPRSRKEIYEVEICRKGKRICCPAIYDSGNLLVSQITGSGITVLEWEKGKGLFGQKEKEMIEKYLQDVSDSASLIKAVEMSGCGIYSISYCSVGKKQGYMPGIMADNITVRKAGEVLAAKKGMIGISAEKMSKNEKFSALLPEDIFS